MFHVVVNKLLVNLVGQNVDVFLGRNIDNRLQLFARVNRSGRIARAVQDQHFRARCHRVFKIFRAHFPGVALSRRDDHGLGADETHHVRIAHPIRRGDDDFIAGLTCRENCVVAGMFRAIAHYNLVCAIFQAVVGRQFFRDCLTQLRNTGARRVFGETSL